jgi:Nitroreductase family
MLAFKRNNMFAKMQLRYEPLPLPDRTNIGDQEMQVAADAFYDRIRQRHTVRDFSDRPVALSVIESCIRAAGTAPSGANHQPWHFVAIADREIKHRIRLAAEEEDDEEAQARLDYFNAGADVDCIEDIARGYNMNPNIDQVSALSKRYAGGERNSISDPLVGSYDTLARRMAKIVLDSDLDGIILIVPDYVRDLQAIAKRTFVKMKEHGVICGSVA